jgi:hypothetical protein
MAGQGRPFPPSGTSSPVDLLEERVDLTPEQNMIRRQMWCRYAFEEGKHFMKGSDEVQKQDEYIGYLLGKQWPKNRPSYKSAPINNRLMRLMEKLEAVLTDLKPTYEVSTHNKAYQDQAEILTKTTKAWWMNNDNDLQMAMAVIHAYLSTGYLRIKWNPTLMGGMGDFELEPLGIAEIMPIGPSFHLQRWEGVIYRAIRPMSWFQRTFPLRGHLVKPSHEYSSYQMAFNRPRWIGQHSFDLLSPQMKRILGGSPKYIDSIVPQAPYTEFWIRDWSRNTSSNTVLIGPADVNWSYKVPPGELLYPRGRVLVTGGDTFEIMDDGPNPRWHGRWPFIPIRIKPVPWQFHGISEMMTKIPHQDIINHILAGTLDMIKKAINPPLMFPNNAFSPAVRQNMDPAMPNAKIGYSPLSPSKPEYARPPELPSWVFNTLMYMQNEMDDDSGLLDLPGLARKKVTPAGDTLEELKESQQTIMRLRGRFIEYTMREIGEQMAPNFMQMYTVQRRMYMFGAGGVSGQDVFDWNPETMVPTGIPGEEHIKNFVFSIQPGSLLNANAGQETLLKMALRRQGDYSLRSLFEDLGMGNKYDQVLKELQEEGGSAFQQAVKELLMQALAESGIVDGAPGGGAGGGGGGKGSLNIQNLLKQTG